MNSLKTVLVACMILFAMCLPVSACTQTKSTDTCNQCGLDKEECNGNCGATGEDCSCPTEEELAPEETPSGVVTGAISCDNGTCEQKLCINGTCYENAADNTSAEDVKAAIECNGKDCKTVVCNDSGCTTDSFTITDTDESYVGKWIKEFLGGKKEVEVEEVTPVVNTSDVNYYGTIANGNSASEEVSTEEVAETPVCKPIKPVCSAPKIDVSACKVNTGKIAPVTVKPCETGNCTSKVTPMGNSGCDTYNAAYQALRADKTEKKVYSNSYQSLQYAKDVKKSMDAKKIDCSIVKVTFTDGKISYLNKIKTCEETLYVDSCGTVAGTGIKKVVTLEKGKQWTAKSLFKECPKTYTRGIVKSIE